MKSDLLSSAAVEAINPRMKPQANPWGGDLLGIVDHGEYIQTNLLVNGEVVVWRTRWYDTHAMTWRSKVSSQSPCPFRADGIRDGESFIGVGYSEEQALEDLEARAGGVTTPPPQPERKQ